MTTILSSGRMNGKESSFMTQQLIAMIDSGNVTPDTTIQELYDILEPKQEEKPVTRQKRNAIICDLDGTLFNIEHRRHFVEGEFKDWKKFSHYTEIRKDSINKWCKMIIDRFSKDHAIIFVTGRHGSLPVTRETREMILKNIDLKVFSWKLLMRKDGDYRKDTVVKLEIYKEHIEPNYNVLFCIDDRQSVVDMWRENGLVCLQCDKGDF